MRITKEDEALVERLKGEVSRIEDDYWKGLPIDKLLDPDQRYRQSDKKFVGRGFWR